MLHGLVAAGAYFSPTIYQQFEQRMTTETDEREAKEAAFARDRAHVEKTRRFLWRMSWALAAGFVAVIVILGSAVRESYQTWQREAGVFAGAQRYRVRARLLRSRVASGYCRAAARRRRFSGNVSFATVAGRAVAFCVRA